MIRHGDALTVLRTLEPDQFHCCVTSPPYFALRDYGTEGQMGLEKTPEEYIERMTEVFREVRRVLRPDGTLWLNIGDSYVNAGGAGWQGKHGDRCKRTHTQRSLKRAVPTGLKEKDMIGIPWMLAFALRADGWWLRQEIIWHKANPMPESVYDRCTKAHEQIFLMAKGPKYHFDHKAIAEPTEWKATRPTGWADGADHSAAGWNTEGRREHAPKGSFEGKTGEKAFRHIGETRNKRSVWSISSEPFPGSHFATFPPKLIVPCVLAGCPPGGTVLDPFFGAGTTGVVARRLGRNFLGIEINKQYVEMAEERIRGDAPLFNNDICAESGSPEDNGSSSMTPTGNE